MNNRLERAIGWPSHQPPANELPAVQPISRADDSPMVTEAYRALVTFGGEDMQRGTVRQLLPMWAHFQELGARDMVAVLLRFPGKGDQT